MRLSTPHVTPRLLQGLLLGVLLVAILAGGLVLAASHRQDPSANDASSTTREDRSVVDASGARTRLTGLTPATGEPTLPGLATLDPTPGTVAQAAGPFDDRFGWTRLTLDRTQVTGTLTVTSDVSDLLELQVVAGFYDRAGRLVSTRRFVHHETVHDEAGAHLPVETERVAISIPKNLRGTVVSAAVGVPILVNE